MTPADMEGRLEKLAAMTTVDPTPLDAYGRCSATFGDLRALLKAYQERGRALGELIDYAEECIARLDCHDAGIMGDEPIKAARAALTGEDTAGSLTSQNTEPGLPFSDAGKP